MEQKIVNKLSNEAKSIKIMGQDATAPEGDCLHDCHIVEEIEIGREFVAFTVCYKAIMLKVADYYNEHWSSRF